MTTRNMPTIQAQSHLIIENAFTKFKNLIHDSDALLFKSTTLADVREAARIIERDQAQRKCLRNLRRLEPLLQALGTFGGTIETLCQGTPYLCYIWVCDTFVVRE